MSRGAARAANGKGEGQSEGRGLAHALGWYCFLAFVALTPLVVAVLPPQVGSLASFRGYDTVGLPKAVAILVLSGLSLAGLCVSVARGQSELHWHPVMWILCALLGWAGVSTLFSASPALSVWGRYHSNEGLLAILGYTLVAFLAIQYVRSTRALGAVLATAVISGSAVSAYCLLQFWGVDPITWAGETSRVFSTLGNADMLGTYLVFPFALAIGLALSARDKWPAVGWWCTVTVIAVALLITMTRGAWLGALVVLLCLAIPNWRGIRRTSRRQRMVFGGLAIAVMATIAFILTRPEFTWRFTASSWGFLGLANGRLVIWLTGLRGWLAHPITGWGPDAFGRAFQSAVGSDWYAIVAGLNTAENAHSFLIQVLVTLGIPGLLLTVWALARTAIQSFRGTLSMKGRARVRFLALWSALVGMTAALAFGVTLPGVSVWLWLTVGLLLAPLSHRVSVAPRVVLATGATVGLAVALWAGSWLVADVIVGRATQMQAGPAQVLALERAVRLNPLSSTYHWLVAEGLVNEALAEEAAGQDPRTVDVTTLRALSAFDVAARVDPGDAMVRAAFANVLVSYASRHPRTDAAQRAVQVALEAAELAPRNPAVLGALARAYKIAGRRDEAEVTARLARAVAPEYAAQTLGSLGLESTTTP